jgi:demethylmenaquinone methyltransferase/2-methoxy-6-polyprenyl-1,4-benzoquinol methylase
MSKRINDIFSDIYEGYDLLNHLFSFGLDIGWRREVARMAVLQRGGYRILDMGTGTGDLAISVWDALKSNGERGSITGIDLNAHMLSKAVEKAREEGIGGIRFEQRDALKTGYRSGSFDVIVSGFMLRNVDSIGSLSKEMARLLRPGGRILLLDMAYPKDPLACAYFDIHLGVMAAIGSAIGKNSYGWLFSSIKTFDKRKLVKILSKDFDELTTQEFFPGIAYVVSGCRKIRP